MSTKKKVVIICIIIAIVIAVASCGICFGNMAQATETTSEETYTSTISEDAQLAFVKEPVTFIEEGYNGFGEWYEKLVKRRESIEKTAASKIELYGQWMTDEEKVRFQELESEGIAATNLTDIDTALKEMRTIWLNAKNKKEAEEEAARIAAEEAAAQEAARIAAEQASYNNYYNYSYTDTSNDYSEDYSSYDNGSGLTKSGGVNYYNGRRETYYSSQVLYHYRTNEWTADSEGFYRDSNGYYIVAASDMAQGTTFEGSKGTCIVADSGCADGTTDYYVNWG